MKKLFLALTTMAIGFWGCDKCAYDECPSPMRFSFRVQDAAGDPWVAPANTPYYIPGKDDSVRVIAVTGANEARVFPLRKNGSGFTFQLDGEVPIYIIQYSFAESDTVYVQFIREDMECCGHAVIEYKAGINRTENLVSNYESDNYVIVK